MSAPRKDGPLKDGEGTYWLDKPANVDLIWKLLVAACAILFAADFFYEKYTHFHFESWHGFFTVYGFVAYCAIVLICKPLRKLLGRDGDYYDR